MLPIKELQRRANAPRPSCLDDFAAYQRWRLARLALGLPLRSEPTQAELLRLRARRRRQWAAAQRRKRQKRNAPRDLRGDSRVTIHAYVGQDGFYHCPGCGDILSNSDKPDTAVCFNDECPSQGYIDLPNSAICLQEKTANSPLTHAAG